MKYLLFILIIPIFFIDVNAYNGGCYIILDSNSNRIIEGNNYNIRHLTASISKVLTAIIVIENGNIKDEVIADSEAINQEGSSIYLNENEKYTVEYLLYGLLLRSGNDCANLLARYIGNTVEGFSFIMNEYAKMLGMKNSTFENPSGLDSTSKNYSTCYDMAILMSYCSKNEVYRKINSSKSYDGMLNKHKLIQQDSIFQCGKTGYTKLCGRTLITTAKKNNKEFICVTFEVSDDFNFHKKKLIQALNDYKIKKVLKKSYVKQKLCELDYLLYYDDLKIPVSKKENIACKIALNKEELIVYSNSLEILRIKLKKEYIKV